MTTDAFDQSKLLARGPSQVTRELLHRSLFEHALLEVHIWQLIRDDQGSIVNWRLIDANALALKSWGLELSAVLGKTTDQIFPDADPIRTFLPIVEEIISTRRPKEWEVDFPATGQVLHMASIPVGEYFVSTGVDVSADRRRERELREVLQSLTQATKAGGVGLWDWDLVTNEVRYSDEWKRQLGFAADKVSNSFDEWLTRTHPDDVEPTMALVRAMIDDPTRSSTTVFRMRHKDGEYRYIMAMSSILVGADGVSRRILGSHVDITERRRLEEQVMESQKLESLGTLAAGIAHDFNNLLCAITGNLSLIRRTSAADPDMPILLKELDDAATRATALTQQLLTFAKGGSPVRDVTPVGDMVIDSARFVTRGSNARCEFNVAEDLDTVEADVGQLSQVINNLVINATQAMPHGGTIRVDAANVTLIDMNEWGLPAGRYVRISVADEGVGIPHDILPRIFDPFFTTKASGSGLGLSTSYSIVARHGGRLAVQSTVGAGTTFDVYLPTCSERPRIDVKSEVLTGKGRILVMDDDSTLLRLIHRMLERLGYECDMCRDGDEAMQQYRDAVRSGRAFDAVILDLTIPGSRGGAQVLAQLRELDPQVVAIVASGYADDDVLARHEAHGFRGRLWKPFSLESLSAEVARVLH